MQRGTTIGLLLTTSLAGMGCGPAVNASSETSTTAAGSTSTSSPTGDEQTGSTTSSSSSTSSGSPTPGSSTSSPGAQDSSSTGPGCIDEGPTLTPDPDDPDSRCPTHDLEFDCGCGYKCNAYLPEEDYPARMWENTGCFPVDPDPVGLGDPCVHEDFAWSGRDNCPDGAMCWDVDGDGTGVCRSYCDEAEGEDFDCGEPDAQPWVGCQSCGCVCQVSCSPLTGGCADDERCVLTYSLGICVPPPQIETVGVGEPCAGEWECEPGNTCVNAPAVPGCPEGSSSCCTPYCHVEADLTSCPEGTSCSGLWDLGDAPAPILEGLGYCIAD